MQKRMLLQISISCGLALGGFLGGFSLTLKSMTYE